MSLKNIRLELARNQDFPQGSKQHGYAFTAPINEDGRIDAREWRAHRDECRVVRFWAGEDDEVGHLVRRTNGMWAFHYDIQGDEEADECGYRFEHHVFKPGEYISINEQDGELRTFRVTRVNPFGLPE